MERRPWANEQGVWDIQEQLSSFRSKTRVWVACQRGSSASLLSRDCHHFHPAFKVCPTRTMLEAQLPVETLVEALQFLAESLHVNLGVLDTSILANVARHLSKCSGISADFICDNNDNTDFPSLYFSSFLTQTTIRRPRCKKKAA